MHGGSFQPITGNVRGLTSRVTGRATLTAMRALFALATFLGASLLFWSEPMLSKQVLPLLGGSPAVWNTCVFLFQALLLAGYAWAHALTRLKSRRWQVAIHLSVAGAGVFFTLHLTGQPPSDSPIAWLLTVMLTGAGLPFFALGSAAPLLQRWFSRVSTSDPYRLYVASNLGSFLALLAFPLLIEPALSLGVQRVVWRAGYGVFLLTLAACAFVYLRGQVKTTEAPEEEVPEPLTMRRRLRWLLLSAAPSSLVLGTTTQLTTDLAAMPLLWVVPLSLYLLTFVLAFGSSGGRMNRLWPLLAVLATLQLFITGAGTTLAVGLPIMLHLIVLFLAARLCHGELAADRPSPARLTEFYLVMSLGGALGGAFNGVVAPLVFDSLAEYPIALIACVALGPMLASTRHRTVAASVGLVLAGLWFAARAAAGGGDVSSGGMIVRGLIVYLAPVLALAWAWRAGRIGAYALVAGPMLVVHAALGMQTNLIVQERSFFGLHRVMHNLEDDELFHGLVHGGTIHGLQRRVEDARRDEPLMYYHPEGPAGAVFQKLASRDAPLSAGLVGLGAGALAAYGRPGDRYTFFEIDPIIARLASDPAIFSYVPRSKADVDIVLGDGRLKLAQETGRYDLLVLDAFSSDAIPVHLLTKEAIENVYLPRLADHGWLLLHLSNRYLQLDTVVGGLAQALQLDVWLADDDRTDEDAQRVPSTWMLLSRRGMADEIEGPLWVRWSGEGLVWTDDYSNLYRVMSPW